MSNKTERALIAVNYLGIPVILTTDGASIHWLMTEIPSTNAREVGLVTARMDCKEHGLYLWSGFGATELVNASFDSGGEPEVVFHGTIRRVDPHEIDDLFKMTPPDEFDDRETPTI